MFSWMCSVSLSWLTVKYIGSIPLLCSVRSNTDWKTKQLIHWKFQLKHIYIYLKYINDSTIVFFWLLSFTNVILTVFLFIDSKSFVPPKNIGNSGFSYRAYKTFFPHLNSSNLNICRGFKILCVQGEKRWMGATHFSGVNFLSFPSCWQLFVCITLEATTQAIWLFAQCRGRLKNACFKLCRWCWWWCLLRRGRQEKTRVIKRLTTMNSIKSH